LRRVIHRGLDGNDANTIDGVADLIIAEAAVVLDFSRVDLVDIGGARAAVRMIRAILLGGSHLQITEPMRLESRAFLLEPSVSDLSSLCSRTNGLNDVDAIRGGSEGL
jgi:hypothetical protein